MNTIEKRKLSRCRLRLRAKLEAVRPHTIHRADIITIHRIKNSMDSSKKYHRLPILWEYRQEFP